MHLACWRSSLLSDFESSSRNRLHPHRGKAVSQFDDISRVGMQSYHGLRAIIGGVCRSRASPDVRKANQRFFKDRHGSQNVSCDLDDVIGLRNTGVCPLSRILHVASPMFATQEHGNGGDKSAVLCPIHSEYVPLLGPRL